MRPSAPDEDSAIGLKLLSTLATAAKRLGLIPYFLPDVSKQDLKGKRSSEATAELIDAESARSTAQTILRCRFT
jgi:hypothetical protein